MSLYFLSACSVDFCLKLHALTHGVWCLSPLCAVRCVRPRLCSTGPNSATGSMERAANQAATVPSTVDPTRRDAATTPPPSHTSHRLFVASVPPTSSSYASTPLPPPSHTAQVRSAVGDHTAGTTDTRDTQRPLVHRAAVTLAVGCM
jgi:hypothetical protein